MIFLIGGTHDSRQICHYFNQQALPYFMSVATELGRTTYQNDAKRLIVGRLDQPAMEALCQIEGVKWIIDASHPHAAAVSENAMACASRLGINYVRWLRQEIDFDESQVMMTESFESAYEKLKEASGRILITGSKELEKAAMVLPIERIVARIVPNSESIAICEKIGLDAGQIIGLKGPFTDAMNQLIFKEWQISHIVFKESGSGSGFLEKIHAAKACGVNPIVVRQPKLVYPLAVDNLEALQRLIK